jgi:hypothetical protein
VPLRLADWQDAGIALDAAFFDAPPEGEKAIDALHTAGATVEQMHALMWEPYYLKHYELSWAVASRTMPPAGAPRLSGLLDAYKVLKTWKGEPAALQWLQPQVKPNEIERVGEIGFSEGEEELAWTVSTDVGSAELRDNTWLLRAAGTRRTKALAARLPEARAHYETDAGAGTYWNEMGKYVVGLTDDKAIASLAKDTHTICEASFYTGARAEGEGRYADANDFYRSAIEATRSSVGECTWAAKTLYRWKKSGLPLARMGELAYPSTGED